MQTQTAAASLYAILATYPADQRDAILVALCALQLAAVPGRGTAIVEPDKPVVDVPVTPDVPADEKPVVGGYADGQEIKNWYGESIKARYKDGVLYATSGGADTFRDRGFLAQIGLTAEQAALFADTDPRSITPIDTVPDVPVVDDKPVTDGDKPAPTGYRVEYGWRSNPNLLDVEATLVNGVVKLRNKANPGAPNPLIYEVNGGIRIAETGQLRRSLDEWESLPGEPILIHLFEGLDATDRWVLRSKSTIHAEQSLTVFLTNGQR
ncbi:hypothetical protein FAES_1819 [Fibrella aestuarina BUZ 2]|uniref:Uncharacterized protein n=1 Tax=Fibrella aestuarina BUZ 2 TaxID=1166018 RepID=I0K6S6_9BACT|nr:hypothetical protein [Fibrella aestuarina]CCG99829.1 hypothetical protein FAES_1819 [Fibrella aestuarina BUZ 2]